MLTSRNSKQNAATVLREITNGPSDRQTNSLTLAQRSQRESGGAVAHSESPLTPQQSDRRTDRQTNIHKKTHLGTAKSAGDSKVRTEINRRTDTQIHRLTHPGTAKSAGVGRSGNALGDSPDASVDRQTDGRTGQTDRQPDTHTHTD